MSELWDITYHPMHLMIPGSSGIFRGLIFFLHDRIMPTMPTCPEPAWQKVAQSPPQWHDIPCGYRGGRPTSNHWQTMAEKNIQLGVTCSCSSAALWKWSLASPGRLKSWKIQIDKNFIGYLWIRKENVTSALCAPSTVVMHFSEEISDRSESN